MSRRRIATALLVVLAAGAVAVVAWSLGGSDDAGYIEVTSDERAVSVQEALARQPTVPFAVRGFAYDDGAFVQLCNGLTDDSPPRCRGPSMLVENLDLARLPLVTAEIGGGKVRYTTEPVVIGGTLDGTVLSAVDVLSES